MNKYSSKKRQGLHPVVLIIFSVMGAMLFYHEINFANNWPFTPKLLFTLIVMLFFSPAILTLLGKFIWWDSIISIISGDHSEHDIGE